MDFSQGKRRLLILLGGREECLTEEGSHCVGDHRYKLGLIRQVGKGVGGFS